MRYEKIDSFRGFVLINMIAYHILWDAVYMYGFKLDWYRSSIGYIWQQSICWSFILLSGFCWSMGKRRLRRGVIVFISGVLVSIVTLLVMPQQRVIFGVLTLIGSAMLLMIVLEKALMYVPQIQGAIVSFFLFLTTKNMAEGYIGVKDVAQFTLPTKLYANMFTTYLGFPEKGFYSTDYFPLFPWLFLFITGYFLYRIIYGGSLLEKLRKTKLSHMAVLGRWSLLIYLVHQPIGYAVLEIFL